MENQAPFATPCAGLARDAGLALPPAWLRTRLKIQALELRLEARERMCMQAAACADALEDMASGEVEAARQALADAAAMWGVRQARAVAIREDA